MLSIARRSPLPVGGRFTAGVCAAMTLVASLAAAQQPSTSREELIRKWDLDRDGKITDGEAEVARSRMRRARLNAELGAGTDPLTGRPRSGGESAPGSIPASRPELGSSPASRSDEDGGLILVPGTGDRGGRPLGLATEPAPTPRREREALPGNRAPESVPPVPQAAARPSQPGPTSPVPSRLGGGSLPGREDRGVGRDERSGNASRELTSRARILPGGPPQATFDGSRPPPPPNGPRPGVISGGATLANPRPAIPAVRPGYGAGGGNDLNAGRLPAGLPAGRGNAAGSSAAVRTGPETQPVPGRRLAPGMTGARPPLSSPPPLPPPPSRAGAAAPAPRSTAVPRVPRPGADNVYGR